MYTQPGKSSSFDIRCTLGGWNSRQTSLQGGMINSKARRAYNAFHGYIFMQFLMDVGVDVDGFRDVAVSGFRVFVRFPSSSQPLCFPLALFCFH